MKKTLAILMLLGVFVMTQTRAIAQRVRTTAVFDADTTTRPKAGFYGIGVRSGNAYLVPATGTTKRLLAASTHVGSSGQYLYSNGTLNYFKTPTLADVGVSGLTTNYISKWNGSGFVNSAVFESGGNVGIGTGSPLSALDVRGINGGIPSLSSSPTGTLLIGSNETSAALSIGVNGGSYAYLQYRGRTGDGGSYPLVLNPLGGNVGIGTTSPSQKLDVSGYGKFQSGIIGNSSGLTVYGSESSATGMFLNTAGNLGIGTTTPLRRLDIKNAAGITQTMTLLNNDFVNGSTGTSLQFYTGATTGNTTYNIQSLVGGETGDGNLNLQPVGGNVGIGTTAPTSKLQVVGLPVYADNTAATSAGLTAGAFYRTALGILMVVY